MLDDVASGTIGPLPAGAWDHDAWTAWAAPYIGTSWQDAPFLWSESYFYRQLLEATGFFEPGPWQRVDPFARMKAAGLSDPGLAADLAALGRLGQLSPEDQDAAVLLAALHGKQLPGSPRGSGLPSRPVRSGSSPTISTARRCPTSTCPATSRPSSGKRH